MGGGINLSVETNWRPPPPLALIFSEIDTPGSAGRPPGPEKLHKEFPKGGYIYKTEKNVEGHSCKQRCFYVSIWGIILAILALATSSYGKNRNEEIVLSTALSILLPSVIKSEWRKKRSFSAPGLISAIVLVFLIAYLGVHLYWIIGRII